VRTVRFSLLSSPGSNPDPRKVDHQKLLNFQRKEWKYRGTSFIRKRPTPWDHHRALGVGLLQGPKGRRFLVSEVPLYLIIAGFQAQAIGVPY